MARRMRWFILLCACGTTTTSDPGFQLRLTAQIDGAPEQTYLTLSTVTLKECAQAAAKPGQSHSAGSATKIGVPHVLSSAVSDLGTMAPPPGSYCELELELSAADSDAEGLPSPDYVGASISYKGMRGINATTVTLPHTLSLQASSERARTLALHFNGATWDADTIAKVFANAAKSATVGP